MSEIQLHTSAGKPVFVFTFGDPHSQRAVLLIHDFWGITGYSLEWARRFADAGFMAMVIDLYDGDRPTDQESAMERMRTVDQMDADAKLATAIAALQEGQRRVGVMGWSFGGIQAQYATLANADKVAATVFFYSRVVKDVEALRRLNGHVLGIYSESERTWPDKQQAFEAAMARAGKTSEALVLKGAHGFCNPQSPRYDAVDAEKGFQAALAFFKTEL